MAKPYNGYPSWNSWNVSLWINNDYELYMTAYTLMQSKEKTRVINLLTKIWEGKRTPDGAVFNKRSIKLALEGMDE